MIKLIIMAVSAIVVCATVYFTTNRICDTLDSHIATNTDQHQVLKSDHEALMKDHEALMRVGVDTNEKVTFLYNLVKCQNPAFNDNSGNKK